MTYLVSSTKTILLSNTKASTRHILESAKDLSEWWSWGLSEINKPLKKSKERLNLKNLDNVLNEFEFWKTWQCDKHSRGIFHVCFIFLITMSTWKISLYKNNITYFVAFSRHSWWRCLYVTILHPRSVGLRQPWATCRQVIYSWEPSTFVPAAYGRANQ